MSMGSRPGSSDPDDTVTSAAHDAGIDDTSDSLSPMIMESLQASGPSARATGGLIKVSGRKQSGSLLTHNLPESTSYAGNHLVALERPASDFRAQPGADFHLEFNGTTHVECGCPSQLQDAVHGANLTIEAWIRPKSTQGFQFIVGLGQTQNAHVQTWLRINDGHYEFGCWEGTHFGISKDLEPPAAGTAKAAAANVSIVDWQNETYVDPKRIRIPAEDIDSWVHLAGVFDAATGRWSLYRNGDLLATSKARPVQRTNVEHGWYIGAVRDVHPSPGIRRFFKGSIAEVRIWTVPRSAEEIAASMYSGQPQSSLGKLGALWRLNEGSGTVARDLSGNECRGTIREAGKPVATPKWVFGDAPTGELKHVHHPQHGSRVDQAFNTAKTRGLFDPLVFPRVHGTLSEADRQHAIAGLRDLTIETFRAFYETGQHLVLQRTFGGGLTYVFVPTPKQIRPKLFLIEEYRLSSFLGGYGFGRTLKTYSLLPGELSRLSVRPASQGETARQCRSIFDSYSQDSAADFENALAQEHSRKYASGEDDSYTASASGSALWRVASVRAEAGNAGSLNSSREEFGKTVSNATSKHGSKASAYRNVQIDPLPQTARAEDPANELVREIENINTGHTLNFVFRQMNQEFITLLHLVDVRVGFTSALEPVREVPLYELDNVLERLLVDDPEVVADVRRFIVCELRAIKDFNGVAQPDFVLPVDPADAHRGYHVNRDFSTTYKDPRTGIRRSVSGVIVSAKSIVMRTEDVVVEAVMGQNPALDKYAEDLQAEEIRTRRLENDRLQRQNRLLELEAQKQSVLLDLVRQREVDLLRAYVRASDGPSSTDHHQHVSEIVTPANTTPEPGTP
jgi:hypothetical protein